MFLFEGIFGNILHTGDCRLTPECLLSLPEKYVGKKGKEPRFRLDYVFLDCTFGRFHQKLPSKHSAIRQVPMVLTPFMFLLYCVNGLGDGASCLNITLL
jgi:DNA cross-link repair 1A protein